MRFSTYDQVRECMPQDLPWFIIELLIAQIVVENMTAHDALRLGRAIAGRRTLNVPS